MSTVLIVGIICGVICLIFVIWFFSTWNRLTRLDKDADRAWSNIDVLLQQRYDMLPNLVNTVKGYASHEKEMFDQFAEARMAAVTARQAGDVSGVSAAEGMLAGIMPKIYAVSEAYPELKANENFLNLQKEIVSIENQVSDRREFYNSSATNFNTAIEMIPSNIVAGIKNCRPKDLFTITTPEVRERVNVEF